MRIQQTQATTTVDGDIIIPSLFGEARKSDIPKIFRQNMKIWFGFDITSGTMIEGMSSALNESEMSDIPEPMTQDTSASLKLDYNKEIESGVTQEFTDIQHQLPTFPFYSEEDILNLDAIVATPPPRESGTIRVKLIYEEPSKPIPVEDPWEE